jgi:hypothetical protein
MSKHVLNSNHIDHGHFQVQMYEIPFLLRVLKQFLWSPSMRNPVIAPNSAFHQKT